MIFQEAQLISNDPTLRAAFFQAHSEKLFLEILELHGKLAKLNKELAWAMSQARSCSTTNDFARTLVVRWATKGIADVQ